MNLREKLRRKRLERSRKRRTGCAKAQPVLRPPVAEPAVKAQKRHFYDGQMVDFLRDGFARMRVPALTEAFNQHFGLQKTCGQIRAALKNHKITCGRAPGFKKGERLRLLNEEQAAFVSENYPRMPLAKLTRSLNRRFNLEITEKQMRSFTRNHRIRSGRTGQFGKGNTPWNDGTKGQGICRPNSGTFQKGNVPGNLRPLGAERICRKDGYVLVKIAEPNPYTGGAARFKAKHTVIWEQHHGPLPENMVLAFLDGDKTNCAIENLELVSRSELLNRNRLKLSEMPEELKPVTRTLAKLRAKTFERQKKLKEAGA